MARAIFLFANLFKLSFKKLNNKTYKSILLEKVHKTPGYVKVF